MPAPDVKADFVSWKIDLNQSSGTTVPDPVVIIDVPLEFPRIDERFMTSVYDRLFLNVFIPEKSGGRKNIFHGLNGLAMHNPKTGLTRWPYGDDPLVQGPVFIPRTPVTPEGDGWVVVMIERRGLKRNDSVVLDTREFEKPVAIVQLPLHLKAQIHGNWIYASILPE